jgi:hypothetical protein
MKLVSFLIPFVFMNENLIPLSQEGFFFIFFKVMFKTIFSILNVIIIFKKRILLIQWIRNLTL